MEIKIGQIIFQLINFGILLFLLSKFLHKPILKILEERSNKIKEGLKAAEESVAERAEIEEKKKQILIETEKEAAEILEKAHQQAAQSAKEIVRQARLEAQKTAQKEHQLLQTRLQEEEIKLRRRIAELVSQTTTTILQKSLSPKDQQKIIEKQVKQLSKK